MATTVADVMTPQPATVTPTTTLKDAIQIMAAKRIGGLPVIGEDGQLAGILSQSDLMWQATGIDVPIYIMFLDSVIYLKNPAKYNQEIHKALGQLVKDVMTEPVVTVPPEASLKHAAQIMHEKRVRRLPVVDEAGSVIGMLTRGDIVREMARSYEGEG